MLATVQLSYLLLEALHPHTQLPLLPCFPQDVLVMSAAYGSYMASSSNLRYQVRHCPHGFGL